MRHQRKVSPPRGSRSSRGIRAVGASSQFVTTYVPVLWEFQVAMFGITVAYWLGNDPATETDIDIIWKEGAEDEDVSPGRYSRALVRNGDLPREPLRRDVVIKDGTQYEVVRVEAFPLQPYCQLILQDREEEQ